MELDEIMRNVFRMRETISKTHTLDSLLKEYSEFKSACPKLFEMVLENKQGYMEELQKMVIHAKRVKTGEASLEDATKVVKNIYDNKYIYPNVVHNLSASQKSETEEYIKNQQDEVEMLEKKWNFKTED